MFDLSFSECLVIGLGALIVTRPEDIPGAARNVGRWIGRLRALRNEWGEQLRGAAEELTGEPRPGPSSVSPPAAAAPSGHLTMYRPEGSDQAYERYVEALHQEEPEETVSHDAHDTDARSAEEAMRIVEARLKARARATSAAEEEPRTSYGPALAQHTGVPVGDIGAELTPDLAPPPEEHLSHITEDTPPPEESPPPVAETAPLPEEHLPHITEEIPPPAKGAPPPAETSPRPRRDTEDPDASPPLTYEAGEPREAAVALPPADPETDRR